MQLVLSNNRILAHGENFLAMGGVVINTETGAKYENATIAECSGCPSDIGVVGYEYHAGRFVPCAPFGKGTGNIAVYCDDCKTPRDSGMHIGLVGKMSSYLAFVGNINEDMVAAAFGKGNEDIITGVGEALAMYGWYKGDNNSYTNLRKMLTINDINNDIYDEIINSDNISDLILANEYAKSKFVETHYLYAKTYSGTATDYGEHPVIETKDITITDEDLKYAFRYKCSFEGTDGYGYGYVQINDVEVCNYDRHNDAKSKTEKGMKNWSDYGITSPGTYTIKVYTDKTNASGNCSGSFWIYKMKQSYDV